MSTYPFYSSMAICPCPKILCHNTIQTIQLQILFQWDQNYFFQSNKLFTQYILTPVHPLNTTYEIIYLSTLWVDLCPHTILLLHGHFHLSRILCCKMMIQNIQLHILFQWIKIISFSQIYFSLNIF